MMSSKQLVFVASFVTLAAVAVNANSLTVGARKAGDGKLWGQEVKKPAVAGKYVIAKANIDVGTINIINQIVAQDQENNGATAKLTYGGPGNSKALLIFTSGVGGDINFTVDIYDKRGKNQ